jgi:hypothetical protein
MAPPYTYYVDSVNGSDSNNGTSTATPWQTIAHVNAQKCTTFVPGSMISYLAGDTWREELAISCSGSSGKPITFNSYGNGAMPVINGADLISTWTQDGSLYYAAVANQPNQVFWNGSRLVLAASQRAVVAGSYWWGSATLYVYGNPAGQTVEASDRPHGIYASGESYINVSNIETDKTNFYGIYITGPNTNVLITGVVGQWNYNEAVQVESGTNTVLSHSTAAYNGGNGFGLDYSPGVLVDHVIAHNNCELSAPSDVDDGVQQYTAGIKLNGSSNEPNATVQYSQSYNNGVGQSSIQGFGIWADTVGTGFTAQYNLIYGNNQVGIQAEADSGISILYNVVYGTVNAPGGTPAGIYLAGDNASIPMTDSIVANNTVYGNGGLGIALYGVGGCTNVLVENNISYGNADSQFTAAGGCNQTTANGNVYAYNDFGVQSSQFIMWGNTMWSTYASTYSAWETGAGGCGSIGCSHSIQSDRSLTNPSAANFTLQSGAPAIGAGSNLGSTYILAPNPTSSFPWTLTPQCSAWNVGVFAQGNC